MDDCWRPWPAAQSKMIFIFSGIKDANMITRSLTSHLWMTCCFPSLHSSDKLPHTKQNTEKPSAHVKLQTACDDPRPETGPVIKVPASAASCNPAAAAAAAQSLQRPSLMLFAATLILLRSLLNTRRCSYYNISILCLQPPSQRSNLDGQTANEHLNVLYGEQC